MTVKIAYKTLQAIDIAIRADQGAVYRRNLGLVIGHIGDAYDDKPPEPRSHLGASILGQDCGRAIAYSWRWANSGRWKGVGGHDGRVLRLFNRGHLEEARFIAILLTIGAQIYQQDASGKQFRIAFGHGHGGGSGDGIAVGIPDIQAAQPVLCEFKTHGSKSFVDLVGSLDNWRRHVSDPSHRAFTGKGVREAKFEHFVQMQIYMRKMGLVCALYMAVCKDTDDLYAELVTLDIAIADEFIARGERIINSHTFPERINKSPGYWKCKFCDHKQACHFNGPLNMNCRTCRHSLPIDGGAWQCGLFNVTLDKDRQMDGCERWEQMDNG